MTLALDQMPREAPARPDDPPVAVAAPPRPLRERMLHPIVALTVLAVFLMVAVQSLQHYRDWSMLDAVRRAQEPTVQEATRLRQQLESLAGQTASLAAEGNAGARAIVEDFRRQGVTLTPPRPAAR